jgi:hypothetical protein
MTLGDIEDAISSRMVEFKKVFAKPDILISFLTFQINKQV